jgi:hypothetical protein
MGLLRADLVLADSPIEDAGLSLGGTEGQNTGYVYADNRELIQRAEGLGAIVEELGTVPPDIAMMFHPFRYYVE